MSKFNPFQLNRMKYNSFRGLMRYNNDDNNNSGGGSGGGSDDNITIKTMRADLEKAQADAKKFKTEFETVSNKLKALEDEKLDENTRLKKENTELVNKVTELTSQVEMIPQLQEQVKGFLNNYTEQYKTELEKLPEAIRDTVRGITFVENDPVQSLTKLNSAGELIKNLSPTGDNPNNPLKGGPNGQPGNNSMDFKNLPWSSDMFKGPMSLKQ